MTGKDIFCKIRFLVCDFDGVFTDNAVIVDENGKESVVCSRADGLGVELLKKSGIRVLVISKERNPVVAARCEKLQIPCRHGIDDKIEILKDEMVRAGLSPEEVCFIGNDLNDVACLQYVVGVAVHDAYAPAHAAADYITKARGGQGAVREVADLILKAKQV